MDNAWFSKIEPYVHTVFKARIQKKFPGLVITTDDSEIDERKFPVVYLHELEQVETGNDLTNVTINAVYSTFQVQVYSKSAAECKDITTEAALQFKKLAFNIIAMPIYSSEMDKTVYMSVMRCRRIIGSGDIDIVPQQ